MRPITITSVLGEPPNASNPKQSSSGFNLPTGTFLAPVNRALKKETEDSLVLKNLDSSGKNSQFYFFIKNDLTH